MIHCPYIVESPQVRYICGISPNTGGICMIHVHCPCIAKHPQVGYFWYICGISPNTGEIHSPCIAVSPQVRILLVHLWVTCIAEY